MKKIITVSLAFALSAGLLSACGGKKSGQDSESPDYETQPQEETAEVSTELESWAPLATVRDRDIVSTDDEFDYEVYEGHTIITSYKGNAQTVEVPAEMGGAPVTEIGFYAFEAKDGLLEVVLPDSVTKICECAFSGCADLYSINMPQSLTEIQRGAFVECTSLTDITIPASVVKVQEEAFTGCTGLTSVTVENPELEYDYWGLEELPSVTVYAPEGSAAAQWAEKINNGEFSPEQ
jgi:hypothetical protein